MKRRRSLYVHLSHIKLLVKKFMLVFLFFTAFVLMLLNKTDNAILNSTSGIASDVVSSLVDVLVIPAKIAAQGYDWAKNIRNIYKDNEALKAENKRLNIVYDRYKSLEVENKLLASLLNYVVPSKAEFITVRVVAEENDAFAHSMTAYVGDIEVKKGQVALSDKGVVGRVDKTGGRYAKIILITDINSKIPVMIENTRMRGILSGDNTSVPKLIFVPLDAKIEVGDRVVTSGVAGVFPAGLPIGKVVGIRKNEITVKPFSSLDQLEYIKLVNYDLDDDIQNVEKVEMSNE